jgi:hypothetical protein
MKTVKINHKNGISFSTVVNKIINNFGKENLHLTFNASNNYTNEDITATFGSDNIEQFNMWSMLIEAKLASGSISGISLVVRRFLVGDKNKVEKLNYQNKTILIPKKHIYHFYIMTDEIVVFDETETNDTQNTNASTGQKLSPEIDIVCKSSEKLLNELLFGKYSVNELLDKVNEIGMENLSKQELEFLNSNK